MTADFADAVTALLGRPLGPDEPFAVALSGGPDSLALLLLARRAFGDRVRAVTVDHGLRPASAAEADDVAAHAATLDLPHATLRWDGPHPAANIHAAARAARYRLMAEWCAASGIAWLATAHHRDDQAETILLRLARGSGSGGLSGIRPQRKLAPGVTLLRPVLTRTKAELGAIVAAAGWVAIDDPSNRAERFDRTHARALLANTPWLDPARLATAAAALAEVEAAVDWTSGVAWAGRATITADGITVDAAGLPRELERRLLVRALVALSPAATPRGPDVDRLLDRLAAGRGGTLAGILVRVNAGDWDFALAPPRR